MQQDRLTRAFLIVVIIAASVYLAEKAWQLLSTLSDVLLLIALAWLLGFVLRPVVDWLSTHPVPSFVVRWVRKRWGQAPAIFLDELRLPHGAAVSLVYLGLLVLLTLMGVYLVPVIISQLGQLGARLPDYIEQIPGLLAQAQAELDRRNIAIDLIALYQPQDFTRRAELIGATAIQQALALATQVASAVAGTTLTLVLSFYMMLDGRRLSQRFFELIPAEYQDEVAFAARSLDRVFGGFVRGQLLIAFIYGVGATLAMGVAGLNFALVVGIICGVIMLIPIVGAPVAMVLPAAMALLQGTGSALMLLVLMTVYQQILLHLLMPKLMSEAVGMPALLVLIAALVGVRLIGLWGFIFGIPAAAALYAIAFFFIERYQQQRQRAMQVIEGEGVAPAVPSSRPREAPLRKRVAPMVQGRPLAEKEPRRRTKRVEPATTPRWSLERLPQTAPFFLPGGEVGVLLIHGFTATPQETRRMGGYLAERGLTVHGVRLAGHGTTPEALARTTWRDWVASAEAGLHTLRERCQKVFVMGLSLGGSIALHLAAHHPVDGLVVIEAPYTLNWQLRLAPLLRRFVPYWPKTSSDLHDPQALQERICYDRFPVSSVAQLADFLRQLPADLPLVQAPTLLIYARQSQVVPARDAELILKRLASSEKELLWLERGGHVVIEDYDREVAYRAAYQFVRRHV